MDDILKLTPLNPVDAPQNTISGPHTYHDANAQIYDTFPPTRRKAPVTGVELAPTFPSDPIFQHQPLRSSSLLFALASQIPKSISSLPDIWATAQYVKSYFDRVTNLMYFRPRQEQLEMFERAYMWRLSTCSFARKGLLLDAKVTGSILEGTDSIYHNSFTAWIEEFEQEVRARLAQPLSACELQERLTDILDMFLLKGSLLDASTTYQLFCRVAPSFLQIVYSDPTLQPVQENSILVSIAHLFASQRYVPACFVLMDVMGSMIYGVPQLVGYNTDIDLFHHEPHIVEWINCFPGEFQIILARINICRDQGETTGDWRTIEQQLVSWTSNPKFEPKGVESWKAIAWVAVQETWRHTLLIYLYLAICGVPTDDPRIQSSLRQLFQLMGVIRRQDPPISNVHFFAQCLIAGICSHTEKRRKLVRERLGRSAETRFWMFRAPEIVPVLDHLWGGAASGGRAITWNDYLNSRRAVLPLST